MKQNKYLIIIISILIILSNTVIANAYGTFFEMFYSPMSLGGFANEGSLYLEDGTLKTDGDEQNLIIDYNDYPDLLAGDMYGFRGLIRDEGIGVGLRADIYELNQHISGLSLGVFAQKDFNLIYDNLVFYSSVDSGLGAFSLDWPNKEVKREIVGDNEANRLRKWFLDVGANVGIRLRIADFTFFGEANLKEFFKESKWNYNRNPGEEDGFVDVEDEYLPYSNFNIVNPLFVFGVGLRF